MNRDAATARYTASIRSDSDLISASVRTGALDAKVAACPEWDVRTLVEHVSFVHRWATLAIGSGAAPDASAVAKPAADDDLAVWIVDGAAALIAAIEATDPEADTWHPFPFDQKNWVWARRMAMETLVHRWDAETAVGRDASIDPTIASEAIHEYMEIGFPRVLGRPEIDPPSASLHVHCTDTDGEWLIWSDGGEYRMLPVHDKGDAAMRGTAEALLLVLTGRTDRNEIDIVGERAAADPWLDLPGW